MKYQTMVDFHITTGKGLLKINSGQTIDLPEDKARGLIDRGKIKAVSIKWDTLSHTHLQTARSLAGAGISFKTASPAITGAERELNRIWLACLHGEATIDDFKAINEQWAVAIRKAQYYKPLT